MIKKAEKWDCRMRQSHFSRDYFLEFQSEQPWDDFSREIQFFLFYC
jgi:hypothetical protein